jgi:hypothetical protein
MTPFSQTALRKRSSSVLIVWAPESFCSAGGRLKEVLSTAVAVIARRDVFGVTTVSGVPVNESTSITGPGGEHALAPQSESLTTTYCVVVDPND